MMNEETLGPPRPMARRTTRTGWWPVGGALLLLALLLFLGWQARERFLPVEVGTSAPDFIARDLDGAPVSLGELRGQVVLLNVWATWCPPCVEEMPSMQRLHERLGPEGLRVVAVSIDAAAGERDAFGRPGGNVRTFAEEFGITFDIWRDPSGDIQRTYRTTGVPESFVINRDGVIIKKVIGATEWDAETNVELIRRLLRES
ncbi:MAG TPA: TlpA disulfide reductase family protein [Longimicrobiaceae bacterium]|nr:TlpA disulfide reductase family protein [Longimicrobiaceae bacterium]